MPAVMKKKSFPQSAFFHPRVLIAFSFCLTGLLLAFTLALAGKALAPGSNQSRTILPTTEETSQQIEDPTIIGTCDTAGPVEVEATAGTLGPVAYPNLAAAIGAINAGAYQGAINVEICASTAEPGTMFLNSRS